jgi:hypothetical protein
MADKKISALTGASTPLAGTEVLPIVQSGATVKVSIANVTAGRAVSMLSGTITDNIATPVPLNINNGSASTAAGTRVNFQFNGSTVGYVGNQFDGGDFNNLYNASRGHIFTRGATQTMLIDGTNDITVSAGNLKIGTAGKGIDFSANTHAAGMTSELLNDYEEGTWTPTAVSTGGAITSYVSAGTYTKVGRLVYINGYVQVTVPGTASGGMIIDAIPYINGNAGVSGKGQQMALVRESENTGAAYLGFMLSNSTQLRISALTGGSILWVANDQYSFSLCYYTT